MIRITDRSNGIIGTAIIIPKSYDEVPLSLGWIIDMVTPHYFLGISPPDPLYAKVVCFQMGKPCPLAEPHMTVKAQGGLVEPRSWMNKVRSICAVTPPFPAEVKEVNHFGTDIIYLAVGSPGIISLHRSLVSAIGPTPEELEQDHEMDFYVPHLSLVQNIPGWEIDNFERTMEDARSRFSEPFNFKCRSVKVYLSDSQDKRYRVFKEFSLGIEC